MAKRDDGVYKRCKDTDWSACTCVWHIRFTHPLTKEQVRKSSGTNVKDKAMQLRDNEKKESWDQKNLGADVSWTVNELLDKALNGLWAHSPTRDQIPYALGCLREFFGKLLAREVTADHIEEFRIWLMNKKTINMRVGKTKELRTRVMKQGRCISTINRHLGKLKAAYNWGIMQKKVLSHNPVKEVKFFNEKPRRKKLFLDIDETKLMLSKFDGTLYDLIVVGARTGLTLGQILSLKREKVDWKRYQADVTRYKGGEFKAYSVDLTPEVRTVFERQPKRGEYVFSNFKGGMILANWVGLKIRKTLRPLAEENPKFKSVTFHTLRHCFVTHILEAGGDMRVVSEMVGHSNESMTATYAQFANEARLKQLALLRPLTENTKNDTPNSPLLQVV